MFRMERGEFAILISKLDKLGEDISDVRTNVKPGGHYAARRGLQVNTVNFHSLVVTNPTSPAMSRDGGLLPTSHLVSDGCDDSSDTTALPCGEWTTQSKKKRKLHASPRVDDSREKIKTIIFR